MRRVIDLLAHGTMGLVGIVVGALSAVALAIAAIISAGLGLLAFLSSPARALVDRLRHPRAGGTAGGAG